MPEWVEDKIDPFTAGELCRRHKIGVACNQNNLVGLTLEAQRRNIESNTHVNSFLDGRILEVFVC